MTLEDVQRQVHNKFLAWLKMDRLLKHTLFALFYSGVTPQQKEEIDTLISNADVDALESRMKANAIEPELASMSKRELLAIAARRGVKYYGTLSKHELIAGIKEKTTIQIEESSDEN